MAPNAPKGSPQPPPKSKQPKRPQTATDDKTVIRPRQKPVAIVAVPFARTHDLFVALVNVESIAPELDSHLRSMQDQFERTPPREGEGYVPSPTPEMHEDLRRMREERRKLSRSRHEWWWIALDQYHNLQRHWRDAIEVAKKAADAAAWEIDSSSTPPLDRVTVAIKRDLQRMAATIPSPMQMGHGCPSGVKWRQLLQRQEAAISNWIDELRLLLYPRSPSGTELDGPAPAIHASAPAFDDLSPRDLEILQAMSELKAMDEDRRKDAEEIAEQLGPDGSAGYVKARLRHMRNRGYTATRPQRGPNGGSWMLDKGRAALRVLSR